MIIETVDIILLVAALLATVWTVMTPRLLRSVIGLAVVSVLLSIIMYRLNSPIAAVFELSVCAGLVSAIFLSIIGLTVPLNQAEEAARDKARLRRFWVLPLLMVVVGIVLSQLHVPLNIVQQAGPEADVRNILWDHRNLDLLGQIVVLMGGAFGVVILFKEWKHEQ